MKFETDEQGAVEIREVFEPVCLVSKSGERLTVCMRDKGFEVSYGDILYRMEKGAIFQYPQE